jgi:hypothetical protein
MKVSDISHSFYEFPTLLHEVSLYSKHEREQFRCNTPGTHLQHTCNTAASLLDKQPIS